MRDYLFFNFLFQHWQEYMLYAVGLSIALYFITRRTIGYIFDPFHFYYSFTFGTSYAIVVTLYTNGLVDNYYFSFLSLYAFLFLFFFLITSSYTATSRRVDLFYHMTSQSSLQEGLILRMFFIGYFVLALIYLANFSASVFYSSRFEANRGLGGIVRIMDALRLILAAWFYVYFLRKKKIKFLAAAVLISVLGAAISGAKFALLEQLYVILVAGYIAKRQRLKLNSVTIILIPLFGIAFISLVLFILSKTSLAIGYTHSQYIPGAPVTFELLILRILANGDQYYLSLANHILETIKIDHPVLQMFANTFGNGVMSALFNYDFANSDVGRQIWLHWYPNDPIMRGPANHFDLTGYVYFGYAGGALFSCFIGFLLGNINGYKKKYVNASALSVAFISALYCRSLPIILNPSVGIAYIFDILILLVFVWIMVSLCRGLVNNDN